MLEDGQSGIKRKGLELDKLVRWLQEEERGREEGRENKYRKSVARENIIFRVQFVLQWY